MARRWTGSDRGDQGLLFQVGAREMLPPDHIVWPVLDVVSEFDLTEFKLSYRVDGAGGLPHDPEMMVALLIYCGQKGLCSSYEIAAACVDDLGCRVITRGLRVGASTVTDFKERHAQALRNLLVATIAIGYAEKLVDVSVIAGDGTYLEANASRGATVDRDRLLRQIDDLQERVAQADADWRTAVCEQLEVPDLGAGTVQATGAGSRERGRRGGRQAAAAWRRLQVLSRQLQDRQAALRCLQANPSRQWQDWAERHRAATEKVTAAERHLSVTRAAQQARIEARAAALAAGTRFPGPTPVPVEQHCRVQRAAARLDAAHQRVRAVAATEPGYGRINTTDPDSAFMPGKRGGIDMRYNVQAVSCPGPFILSIGTHPCSNDKQALKKRLTTTRSNLDAAGVPDLIGTALYDSGYASEDNFTTDLPVGKLLVAVEKECRQTGRDTTPVTDERTGQTTTSTAAPCWAIMTDRMRDPENATLYKRRAGMIEPTFAQLFARFGRELTYRTIEDVETELSLWAVVHNTNKIIRARVRARQPG